MKFKKPHVPFNSKKDYDNLDENGEQMPSMTKSEFAQDTDIIHILNVYDRTGLLTHINQGLAHYGDFVEGVHEYQDAMNLIVRANETFEALPSDLRARFGNDAGAFLEFCQDPDNRPEMARLGLIDLPSPIESQAGPSASSEDAEAASKPPETPS